MRISEEVFCLTFLLFDFFFVLRSLDVVYNIATPFWLCQTLAGFPYLYIYGNICAKARQRKRKYYMEKQILNYTSLKFE